MNLHARAILPLLCLIIIGLCADASADWPPDGVTVAEPDPPGTFRNYPRIVLDGAGGMIIAWSDNSPDGMRPSSTSKRPTGV